jgi:phospholipase/carboxylesterase
MLPYQISLPSGDTDIGTVAVLLHGRGSHEGDLQALRPLLPGEWALLTPQAPHAAGAWGYGPGWAWYRYVSEDHVEEEGLLASLESLDGFIEQLPEILGAEPNRVLLGGFSQGGTASMVYALTRPGRINGVLNFSGFLANSELLPLQDAGPEAAPVFWGHGTQDPNIPHRLAVRGRRKLAAAGIRVTARDYSIGHWIEAEEVADAVHFVGEVGG